jgi:hypothetical protein
MNPTRLLLLTGFLLSLLGAILPALMVLEMAPSTLFLNFFSFTATVAGIFLGLIGAAMLVREYRK